MSGYDLFDSIVRRASEAGKLNWETPNSENLKFGKRQKQKPSKSEILF